MVALETDQQVSCGSDDQALGVAVDLFADRAAVGQGQAADAGLVQTGQATVTVEP